MDCLSPRSRVIPLALMLLAVIFAGSRGTDLFVRYRRNVKCGDAIKTYTVNKVLECASLCDLKRRCRGFSMGAVRADGKRKCLLSHYLELDSDSRYTCYLNHTSYVISRGRDRGTRGLTILVFKSVNGNDSIITEHWYTSKYLPEWIPRTQLSVIYADGEKCPDANQAMVDINYGHSGPKEQRMLCAAIVPPKRLTTSCTTVTIGEEPKPAPSGENTDSWLNWIDCPYGVLTELYWYEDQSDPLTPYRYTGGKCCNMITL